MRAPAKNAEKDASGTRQPLVRWSWEALENMWYLCEHAPLAGSHAAPRQALTRLWLVPVGETRTIVVGNLVRDTRLMRHHQPPQETATSGHVPRGNFHSGRAPG